MPPFKIGIVGGGTGGPVAAIGLARNGHKHHIRTLNYQYLDIIAGGAVPGKHILYVNADGKVFMSFEENRYKKEGEGVSVFAYRSHLHGDMALKEGVESGMESLSTMWILIHPFCCSPNIVDETKYFPKSASGHNAFRFMLPRSVMENDPVLGCLVSGDTTMMMWRGDNKIVFAYACDFNKHFNNALTHPHHLSGKVIVDDGLGSSIPYNQKVSFDAVQAIYSEFYPAVQSFPSLADPNGVRVWQLKDMDEIPNWYTKKPVLLGDVCHPVSPSGFSGASMGIEDGVTLATLFHERTTKHDISERLSLYERLRKPRVAKVRETSVKIAKGEQDKELIESYMSILIDYNVITTAKIALERQM